MPLDEFEQLVKEAREEASNPSYKVSKPRFGARSSIGYNKADLGGVRATP